MIRESCNKDVQALRAMLCCPFSSPEHPLWPIPYSGRFVTHTVYSDNRIFTLPSPLPPQQPVHYRDAKGVSRMFTGLFPSIVLSLCICRHLFLLRQKCCLETVVGI